MECVNNLAFTPFALSRRHHTLRSVFAAIALFH
jgi:hypothetical protein